MLARQREVLLARQLELGCPESLHLKDVLLVLVLQLQHVQCLELPYRRRHSQVPGLRGGRRRARHCS